MLYGDVQVPVLVRHNNDPCGSRDAVMRIVHCHTSRGACRSYFAPFGIHCLQQRVGVAALLGSVR